MQGRYLLFDGSQMSGGQRVDLSTGEVAAIHHFQQSPDFFDAKTKLPGTLDECKALELTVVILPIAARCSVRLWHDLYPLIIAYRLNFHASVFRQCSYWIASRFRDAGQKKKLLVSVVTTDLRSDSKDDQGKAYQMDRNAKLLSENERVPSTKTAVAAGVLGAFAMTSCCILPLLLFSLGATGAWIGRLGAMYQYKWYIFAFAGASLAYGFWQMYRPTGQTCEDGTACAVPLNQRLMKFALWSSAALILSAVLFPYVSPFLIGY